MIDPTDPVQHQAAAREAGVHPSLYQGPGGTRLFDNRIVTPKRADHRLGVAPERLEIRGGNPERVLQVTHFPGCDCEDATEHGIAMEAGQAAQDRTPAGDGIVRQKSFLSTSLETTMNLTKALEDQHAYLAKRLDVYRAAIHAAGLDIAMNGDDLQLVQNGRAITRPVVYGLGDQAMPARPESARVTELEAMLCQMTEWKDRLGAMNANQANQLSNKRDAVVQLESELARVKDSLSDKISGLAARDIQIAELSKDLAETAAHRARKASDYEEAMRQRDVRNDDIWQLQAIFADLGYRATITSEGVELTWDEALLTDKSGRFARMSDAMVAAEASAQLMAKRITRAIDMILQNANPGPVIDYLAAALVAACTCPNHAKENQQ